MPVGWDLMFGEKTFGPCWLELFGGFQRLFSLGGPEEFE